MLERQGRLHQGQGWAREAGKMANRDRGGLQRQGIWQQGQEWGMGAGRDGGKRMYYGGRWATEQWEMGTGMGYGSRGRL